MPKSLAALCRSSYYTLRSVTFVRVSFLRCSGNAANGPLSAGGKVPQWKAIPSTGACTHALVCCHRDMFDDCFAR